MVTNRIAVIRIAIVISAVALSVIAAEPERVQTSCPAQEMVTRWFTSAHAESWLELDTKRGASLLGGATLQPIESHFPLGTAQALQPCTGSVVLSDNETSPRCFLWAVFDEEAAGENCTQSLQSLTYRSKLTLNAAMILLSRVQEALKAGGSPTGDEWDQTYTWRSRDSKTVYELVTSIKMQTAKPTPDTTVELFIRLKHWASDAEAVDRLPFERGVFLPACSPGK